mgnify:CR=1 FL=1
MTILLLAFSVFLVAQPGVDQVRELDLAGWVALAYQNSPAITTADASLLSSEASHTGNKSFLWPTLNLSAGASCRWPRSSLPSAES